MAREVGMARILVKFSFLFLFFLIIIVSSHHHDPGMGFPIFLNIYVLYKILIIYLLSNDINILPNYHIYYWPVDNPRSYY
jgi:hypothetical protein